VNVRFGSEAVIQPTYATRQEALLQFALIGSTDTV